MSELAADVLRKAADKEATFKSTEVIKDLDLELDLCSFVAVDKNTYDAKTFKPNNETCLRDLARDNTQILINRLWELPTERVEEATVAVIPTTDRSLTLIPREKPIPKRRETTKWEQFAQMKGIQNTKKARMTYDETAKDWKPTWGYKRANDKSKDWLIEVPHHADGKEDQYNKLKEARKERVAKNDLQRMRNIARSRKSKVPGVGLTPVEKPSKTQLTAALSVAQKSDASMGKFSTRAPKEKVVLPRGKKRKFEPNTMNVGKEKSKQLDIFSSVMSKKPQVNADRLANKAILQEQTKKRKENQEASASKKKGKVRKDRQRKGAGKKNYKKGQSAGKGGKGKGK